MVTAPPLHPPLRLLRDPLCLLLPGPNLASPRQRGVAPCQAEAGPTLPTTPKVAPAQVQALAPQAPTQPPRRQDQHPQEPPLLLLSPQPVLLPHTDTQFHIPTHFHTHCQTLADLLMEVSIFKAYLDIACVVWMKENYNIFLCFKSLPEHLPKPKDLHSPAEQSVQLTLTISLQVQSHSTNCSYKILSFIDGFYSKPNLKILSFMSLQPLALLNQPLHRIHLIWTHHLSLCLPRRRLAPPLSSWLMVGPIWCLLKSKQSFLLCHHLSLICSSRWQVLKVESNEALQLISSPYVSLCLQWMRSLAQLQKSAQLRAPAAQRKARVIKVCTAQTTRKKSQLNGHINQRNTQSTHV